MANIKPSHIVMGVVGGVIYTAVCVGASEEFSDDMKQYLETHETDDFIGKVSAAGYYTYRYGLTVGKALLSTVTCCLIVDGMVTPFRKQ